MGNSEREKFIGRSIRRLEDVRFLTGRGRYLADIECPDALWGHVLRSPHAHALIKRIDVSRGREHSPACTASIPPPISPASGRCPAWRR